MRELTVKEISHGSFFSKAVYLDNAGFILTAPEMPFTEELAIILDKWSFTEVLCDGEQNEEYVRADGSVRGKDTNKIEYSKQSDAIKLQKAEEFYLSLLSYVENIFIRASVSDELNHKDITEKIKSIVDYIKEDRRYLMRVIRNIEPAPEKNYLAAHSVRSTIIAIIIGTYLKIPNHRLIELGVAALVHEAGMLKLPSNIYLSQRQLTPHEQKMIVTHPVLGYSMLKSLDFPLSICLAALEHHERENATGYPRRLNSEKISFYSKIIAVACSYEALSTKRPHKEVEKDGYSVMVELLKNEGKSYNDTIVKALVLSLSIYPIGLYVLLTNGKKGQVIDVNPENPKFPIVQIFGEFTPEGNIKTVQTAANELAIVRPLNRSEIEI